MTDPDATGHTDSGGTLVAIHGVGSPEPGDLVRDIADALAEDDKFDRRDDPIVTAETTYPRLRLTGHPTLSQIVEVNWRDIQEPPRGLVGVIVFLVRLLIALIQIGASGWRGADPRLTRPSFAAFAFRLWVSTFGIWIIGLPLISLHMKVGNSLAWQCGWIISIVVLTLLTTLVTVRHDRLFRAGYAWTVINGLAGAVLLYQPSLTDRFIEIVSFGVDVLQGIGFALPILAFFEMLVRIVIMGPMRGPVDAPDGTGLHDTGLRRRDTILPFLVRLAGIYLPMVVLAGFAALVYFVHVLPYAFDAGSRVPFNAWVTLYQDSGLGSQTFHQLTLGAGGLLVGFLVVGALLPFLLSLRPTDGDPPNSGLAFQNRFAISLGIIPAFLVPLGTVALIQLLGHQVVPDHLNPLSQFLPWFDRATGDAIFNRSLLGALLILIFIPLLIGPGRTVLDVTGDVAFYVLRDGFVRKATALPLRQRVEALFDHLATEGHGPIILMGYSQGSVIAADVAQSRADFDGRLVTVGSPVMSLYGRFLKIPVRFETGRPSRWDNLFRPTDFVGGPVDMPDATVPTTDRRVAGNHRKHHLTYWPEPEVREALTGRPVPRAGDPS